MKTFNFKIQRFKKGDPYYTEASIVDPKDGKIYQSVFGQAVDEGGNFLHYTLERLDTLIAEGIYKYDKYFSNANKAIVPRLTIDPQGNDISSRELEHHIANWAYELKGCCAHGKSIILASSTLAQSGIAWHELMTMIGDAEGGTITYETFN